MAIKIDRIDAGSEAEALGLQPGDELLSVDENELNDTLDYDFYTDSSSFHLKAKVADGIREWDVRRAERGPFGCDFSTYLGDQKHSCSNHCMFCFIDQLPPGMRESLYFKDDDERLSFLFGNYITMTNMQDHEIDRIIKMHISPINISVHTTNPQLRVRMLANKRGGEVLKYLPRLVEGGIAVNCQLVLCRGINDGDELRRTLSDLLELTEKPKTNTGGAVSAGQQLIDLAKQYLGTPYVWAGSSPSGFDCSGFVSYVFKNFGYTVNRTAASMYTNGVAVDKSELQPGDAVFFASSSESIGHVGIYIGDGEFIHSSSGCGYVTISGLDESYYSRMYVGARRIAA